MNDIAMPARRQRFPWITLILGTIVFTILIALGTWQVERLYWKEGLLAEIEARTHAAPASLAETEEIWANQKDVDYRTVTATGRLLNDRERHFFATYDGFSGYYIYTPLLLDDGRAVFVNRGFVPYDKKNSVTRPEGQVEGQVTIAGLARNPLTAKPSSIVPNNDLVTNTYYWKDLPTMAGQSGIEEDKLVPFFIDADKTPNPGGLPIGGVTIIDLPNSHLQYAVTWYGLAATLVAIMGVSLWRRYKLPTSNEPEVGEYGRSDLTSR
ncbi:SURF1 family protein [Phyllobacterium zundukense]|uniref:SURF1-like protein n=1 Tax=Phyllobacterium zundukense TaxID=1867719 RepID=A0A2N9VRC0_9HYPH|nr:SURF1 family protein [Phyllobacterium zundukense]ATU92465.1 cytochrome c oxidase assembly protein [Phyllobacterium zundukense]PIO42038.1 cytochrome c oxidase assembly protein [Phyllobacterium zundukense]